MANEREAAGFFLYRLDRDGIAEFLVMRSAAHGSWGVPKGHRDEEDVDVLACAHRELVEETGLADVLVHSGYRSTLSYMAKRKGEGEPYPKTVHYFLARLDTGKVVLSHEHDAAEWLSQGKARTLLKFENLVAFFDKACEYLTTTCKVRCGNDLE
ncbi:MAG: NUDIX domain-containing protein [Planctomycetes bacterium]|nr:NUDIX domain-containing protein [Planctomycetota bacterium]